MNTFAAWMGIGSKASPKPYKAPRPYRRGYGAEQVREALLAHPGASLGELHAIIGGSYATLAVVLLKMTQAGQVVRSGTRRLYRYTVAA